MKSRLSILFAVLVIASMALAACQPATPEEIVRTVVVTQEVQVEGETVIQTQVQTVMVTPEPAMPEEQPVTLDMNWGSEPPTMDPALTTDTTSVMGVENMFVGLTVLTDAGDVEPYLATEWESGEDADGNQTWTFHLRDDIQWVKRDPVTGEIAQEMDADGNPRFVTAQDVVYGVKRTINPATASDYAYVLYSIKNAQAVNGGEEGFTLDDIGVTAPDDTTVQFTMENPTPWFPSIASMWVTKPQPEWTIDEYGDQWTEAGLIVTNGPYTMEEWIHGGELNLVKNPLWVNADEVQIERVHGFIITEASTEFALYENNEVDGLIGWGVPLPEIDRVKSDPQLSQELYIAPRACTYYYGFVNNKPPMDDVRVRKAFVQSIDRQSLIDNVLKGEQIPATSFAPPGIFGAPPPGEVGLHYDPEAAKTSLQEYLDENGMTVDDFNNLGVTLMFNTSEGHALIAAAIQQMWSDNLGVEVNVENQEWAVYLNTIRKDTPLDQAPHIYRLGWCADYADENNWVYENFNVDGGSNDLRRNCLDATCTQVEDTEFDDLTAQAQVEQDPATREELYREAERILAEDEVAYAPIYHYTTVTLNKPWLHREYANISGQQFWKWTIDWDAKQAATGG
jgi:oligopeptide transport system substrate-binding protein